MPKENFLMLSLDDPQTKDIANVVSNNSAKKILNYLAETQTSTESEIAKKLDLPLSTVHYNLKQLVKVGLVISDEYHYSQKGKEVDHYRLADKYIIIMPKKKDKTFRSQLRKILPVSFLSVGAAGAIYIYEHFTKAASFKAASSDLGLHIMADQPYEAVRSFSHAAEAANDTAIGAAGTLSNATFDAAPAVLEDSAYHIALDSAPESLMIISETAAHSSGLLSSISHLHYSIALWFLMGSLFAIMLYTLISWIKKEQ